jgi:hypothetical protein
LTGTDEIPEDSDRIVHQPAQRIVEGEAQPPRAHVVFKKKKPFQAHPGSILRVHDHGGDPGKQSGDE